MGHKTSKGSVSIVNYRGRVRLRWSYQKKRYSLNLFTYNRANLLQAKKIALQIENDLVTGQFDVSTKRYIGQIIKKLIRLKDSCRVL
jgi:integrase